MRSRAIADHPNWRMANRALRRPRIGCGLCRAAEAYDANGEWDRAKYSGDDGAAIPGLRQRKSIVRKSHTLETL